MTSAGRALRNWRRLAAALTGLWPFAPAALAHETTPSVADFRVEENRLHLTLRLNAEAFLAGIDLDHVRETDHSEFSGDYDDLRDLPPERLEPELRAFLAEWLPLLRIDPPGPAALGSRRCRSALPAIPTGRGLRGSASPARWAMTGS